MRMPRSTSYANVAATLALVVALGGTSYAAAMITGADIKDGTVSSADIKNSSVKSKDIRNGTLRVKDFKASTKNALTGPAGADGADGAPGPAGPAGPAGSAKAYGLVLPGGALDAARTSAGVTATNPTTGHYCIAVPGVSNDNGVIVPSIDWSNSSGTPLAVQGRSSGFGCSPGEFEVLTYNVVHNAGTNSVDFQAANQAFSFLVP